MQAAKEIDEVSSVLLKDFGCTPLALLGGCEDEHIDVALPKRLLVLVSGFGFLATSPETIDHLKDSAYQA